MKIIAFTGYAGSGKTAALNALLSYCVLEDARTLLPEGRFPMPRGMSFAGALRSLCMAALPKVPRSYFDGTKAQKETPIPGLEPWTGRAILQHIGTEGFRAVSPNVWVDQLEHQVKGTPDIVDENWVLGVIDDVRFPNEAAMVRKYGKLYRIDRPGNAGAAGAPHESERHIDSLEVDGVILNDGTLDDLKTKVIELLRSI